MLSLCSVGFSALLGGHPAIRRGSWSYKQVCSAEDWQPNEKIENSKRQSEDFRQSLQQQGAPNEQYIYSRAKYQPRQHAIYTIEVEVEKWEFVEKRGNAVKLKNSTDIGGQELKTDCVQNPYRTRNQGTSVNSCISGSR
jgi:hypothetical protein